VGDSWLGVIGTGVLVGGSASWPKGDLKKRNMDTSTGGAKGTITKGVSLIKKGGGETGVGGGKACRRMPRWGKEKIQKVVGCLTTGKKRKGR